MLSQSGQPSLSDCAEVPMAPRRCRDRRILLTLRAFAVLRDPVERAGRLVTRNELIAAVWPDTYVEVLNYRIAYIRGTPETEPGRGPGARASSVEREHGQIGPFSAATDSPVRADSSTARPYASVSRASAGMRRPASTMITSPGTIRSAGIRRCCPPRRIGLVGSASLARPPILVWRAVRSALRLTPAPK